jgi:hypothetical protein
VASDFYTTVAQILPLLMLALIWNSSLLTRLPGQRRLLRRQDPSGVLFWTKPRVRAYTLFVAALVLVLTGVCVLELAGFVPDSLTLRVVMTCGLALVLGTLLTRIWYDVLAATSTVREYPPAGGDEPVVGARDPGAAVAEVADSSGEKP